MEKILNKVCFYWEHLPFIYWEHFPILLRIFAIFYWENIPFHWLDKSCLIWHSNSKINNTRRALEVHIRPQFFFCELLENLENLSYRTNSSRNVFFVWKMDLPIFPVFLHWLSFTNWIWPNHCLVTWQRALLLKEVLKNVLFK